MILLIFVSFYYLENQSLRPYSQLPFLLVLLLHVVIPHSFCTTNADVVKKFGEKLLLIIYRSFMIGVNGVLGRLQVDRIQFISVLLRKESCSQDSIQRN